jgi:outer membrane protein OmpA-like peptidoglycan-associated protein
LIEYQYLYTLKKITMRTSRRFLNRPIQTQQTETAEPFFSPAQPSAVQTKAEESFFAPAAPDTIQTKLSVNAPGDKHEQEADSMADHVVQRMSAPDKEKDKVHRKAAPEKEKDKLQKKSQGQDEEEKGKIQRMAAPDKEKDKNKVQKKSIGHTEEDKDKVHRKAAPDKEKDKLQRKCADCEKEEHGQVQRKADGGGTAPSGVTHQIESSKGNGSQLSDNTRAQMESSFGTDFSNVRIHNNSESAEMNDALHAQAFTHGSDIYFNEGKYNPQNTEGSRLLAHELTHVVQQGGGVERKIQRDIAQSMPSSTGVFEIDMQNQSIATNSRTGLLGTITFFPDVSAPYSNSISLIQIARLRDQGGNNIQPVATSGLANNNPILTRDDATTGVEGGFFTDVLHSQAGVQQDFPLSPNYRFGTLNTPGGGQCFGGGDQTLGYKRSNQTNDIHQAVLADCPGTIAPNANLSFTFETVAKGTDTNVVYGTVNWSFDIVNGVTQNETASVSDSESATFKNALQRHQDFYTHESVVFYFDFNSDTLSSSEHAKIDTELLTYLRNFPDVRINLTGSADQRGDIGYNQRLSSQRANTIAQALIAEGIAPDRINSLISEGETTAHTSDAVTDQDLDSNRKGNRRVVLSFEHTATVPVHEQVSP